MNRLQWVGQCPGCKAWNTLEAFTVKASTPGQRAVQSAGEQACSRCKPSLWRTSRCWKWTGCPRAIPELDRVLGKGVVPGAVVLLGGEPGIGKSTLMLQSVLAMAKNSERILYVAGEESPEQVRMRAERLGDVPPALFVFPETDAQAVLRELEANRPSVVIIDSIQTMFLPEVESAPGSVSQIREASGAFTRFAKRHNVPVLFHWPHYEGRVPRRSPRCWNIWWMSCFNSKGNVTMLTACCAAAKNRFGTTAELGLYEMRGSGLIPVDHPSNALLGQSSDEDSLERNSHFSRDGGRSSNVG